MHVEPTAGHTFGRFAKPPGCPKANSLFVRHGLRGYCQLLVGRGGVMASGIAGGSHRLRVRTVSAFTVLGLIAVSLSTPSAVASTARPGRAKPGISWTNCTEPPAARSKQFQCAIVPVPLDWAKPNGTKIE